LTTDQAVPEVFGVDKADFEKGYREYLDEIVAGLRQTDDEQPQKASQIERAYEKNKTDPKAAADYARLLLLENHRKDAKKIASDVLKNNPSQPIAAAVLGYLLFKEDKIDDAGKALEPALDREHPNKNVLDLLMKVRLKQKRGEEAAELCELGKLFFPYDSDWWKGSSAAARITGDIEKRRAALETLVQIEGDDPAPRKALAEIALSERNYEAAIKYSKLTLHIDVLDADIHRIYGEACRETHDFKRAVMEFETAIELKPKDVDSQLGLAETYLAMDRKDEASKLVDAVLAKEAENERAKSLNNRLK
jgi:tetratricopeptide (TPR) repeat protein